MRAILPLLILALAACAERPAPAIAPAPPGGGPAAVAGQAPAPAPAPASPAASPAPASEKVSPSAAAAPADDPAEVRASNTFTTNLYARVKRAPGNLMISATSLRSALGVALLGARGETARQMAHALDLPADREKVASVGKAETASWNDARGGAELVVANRLWSDKSYALKEDFTRTATAAFGIGVEPVDFAASPADARRTINAWVTEKTSGKITDVLPDGAVDKSTRAVVTNAIYFKARWSSPFPKSSTKDEPFTTGARPAGSSSVPTMHETNTHGFAHVGAAKVLGLRYDGTQLGMLVVLPDDVHGLAKLEESLSAETFESWTKALVSERVAVSLPRFAFQSGSSMEAPLQDLGMRDAFTPKADFSGVSDAAASPPKLQLSRVVQKTWVSVDENGTEAAAASGIAMSVTSAHVGPVMEFKADHPFLYFVYDAKRGRILFAGRVTDPR